MTIASAIYIGLAVLVLALAGWTIFARDDYAAIVGFVTYGLLLSLVWVSLSSHDIALTEAAIGGGVTGALLLGAAYIGRRAPPPGTPAPAHAARPGVPNTGPDTRIQS